MIRELPWSCPTCGRRALTCPERGSHSPFDVCASAKCTVCGFHGSVPMRKEAMEAASFAKNIPPAAPADGRKGTT
jgi:hypothetical protein